MNKNDIDNISLEQALVDFEVANKRVIDLTARLTSMSRELIEARSRLSGGKPLTPEPGFGYSSAEEKLRQISASRVYRMARMFSKKLRRIL